MHPDFSKESVLTVIPAFNPGLGLLQNLEGLQKQFSQSRYSHDILIVDDASTSFHHINEARKRFPSVVVVSHKQNQGRAIARNKAIGYNYDWYHFIDCDSVLPPLALQTALETYDQSAIVGLTDSTAPNFSGRYHHRLYASRCEIKNPTLLSTENFLVKAEVFRQINGYDSQYRYYGFEDRDLLLRLQSLIGDIAIAPDFVAMHVFEGNGACEKMYEGARYSATLFKHSFPTEYRRSIYGKVDRPALLNGAKLLKVVFPLKKLTQIESVILKSNFNLFTRISFKVLSGLSFLYGRIDENSKA